MNTPEISIVLPTFNGSRYIKESIESCLIQTFSNFELIVVNDCSTDNTLSIVQGYAQRDSRIKIINNEFNKKLPLSLNTGFDTAKGKYFTWTSDDNFYASDALETMHEILEKNSSIDLVYTDNQIVDNNNKVIGVRKFGDPNKSFTKWLGAGACFLYKREIHSANNGYNPAAFLIEDYDFFSRAFTKFNFYYLQNPNLYFYREHDSSLTAKNASIINDISKIFLERNLHGLEKKLSTHEINLVYRKLAVFYAVTKSNNSKFFEYLTKMRSHSYASVLVTAFYVFFRKFISAFKVSIAGLYYALVLVFKK